MVYQSQDLLPRPLLHPVGCYMGHGCHVLSVISHSPSFLFSLSVHLAAFFVPYIVSISVLYLCSYLNPVSSEIHFKSCLLQWPHSDLCIIIASEHHVHHSYTTPIEESDPLLTGIYRIRLHMTVHVCICAYCRSVCRRWLQAWHIVGSRGDISLDMQPDIHI